MHMRCPARLLPVQMNYQNKGMHGGEGLMAAMICAGWDAVRGGQVFSLPIGGTMVPVKWAVDGSGSSYIWGFCDAEFKEGMTRAEAEAFVLQATCLAMSTDGSSGGCVRLVTVDKTGSTRRFVPQTELPVFGEELPRPGRLGGSQGGMLVA
jgi:20S proteasome subunit beta 1